MKYAVRNLRLCTKDCLCLYVCPTGATDTENSIIDKSKCIACGACAESCPSKAISMIDTALPVQQKKTESVCASLERVLDHKLREEKIATEIGETSEDAVLSQIMEALRKSCRVLCEDLARESGYMIPQSGNAQILLKEWIENPPFADFPIDTAKKLLELIPANE